MINLQARIRMVPLKTIGVTAPLLWLVLFSTTQGQDLFLAKRLPSPLPNGAIHYQQALLGLGTISLEERAILEQPLWDVLKNNPDGNLPQEFVELVFAGRHALRNAKVGSQQEVADFGVDLSHFGSGTVLPHVQPMLKLGRLVAIAGIYHESQDDWKQAGMRYFQTLRMGRHMTHQRTLLEALVGIEILEKSYLLLGDWAVGCPEHSYILAAFLNLEPLTHDMVAPARTLAYEAGIRSHQFDRVKDAFPDGPWAEMILEAMGEFAPGKDRKSMQKKAISLCVERGIPEKIFQDKDAFDQHINKLQKLNLRSAEATAACMSLPPVARMKVGQRIYKKFQQPLKDLGDHSMINPAETGAYFAMHDAELTLARVVLALAAERKNTKFPEELTDVAHRFGGQVPHSPYDGSPLNYETIDGGNGFSINVSAVEAHGITLPKVEFTSSS